MLQALAEVRHELDHELKLDQLNSDKRVMVSYLRSWAKDGSTKIPSG